MSERRTIYLAGYSTREPSWLLRAAVSLDAVVFDTRYSPRSRRAQWSKSNLSALLGERYVHAKGFGNSLFKTSAILLADPEAGLAIFDEQERDVILLCVCPDSATCHRSKAAAYIAERRAVRVCELADAIREREPRQLAMEGVE